MKSKYYPLGLLIEINSQISFDKKDFLMNKIYEHILYFTPSEIIKNQNGIIFTGGVFRFQSSTNLLLSAHKGEINFSKNPNNKILIHLDISFKQIILLSLTISILLTLILFFNGSNIFISTLVFFCTFLMFSTSNILLTIYRFKKLITQIEIN